MSSIESLVNKIPAPNMARRNYDAVERVLAYSNIGYVDNTIEALGAYTDKGA